MSEWSVATAQHNSHRLAFENLTAQGIVSYFPKFMETSVVRGRKVTRQLYLFGSYFFYELSDKWRSVSGTRGVASLLMWGEQPSRVPEHEIDRVRSVERDGLVILPMRDKFVRGEEVRALAGPMVGFNAIVEGMTAQQRVSVLFNLFGRPTRTTMDASDLEPV